MILIVSSTEKGTALVEELLRNAGEEKGYATSGSEARRLIQSQEPDTVVINTPLSDETGADLAEMLLEDTAACIILLARPELADDLEDQVGDKGVLILPKPVSRLRFSEAMHLSEQMRRRMDLLRRDNNRLRRKLEELRLVDRAKCALIEYMHFTEPEAHRYIEKRAMDERTTKALIARDILDTYTTV